VEFEWDEEKNQSNLRKHGIAFEDAIEVFEDPSGLTEHGRTVSGEDRRQTIGTAATLAVLFVVHTLRNLSEGVVVRIISARPASRRERKRYESKRTEDR
jgi:uncharacterized DUF497 family protein